MKTYTDRQKERGDHYLAMLAEQMASGRLKFWNDVKGDDTDGRITGDFRCGHCGMRSDDPDFPMTCCRPRFIELNLLDEASC